MKRIFTLTLAILAFCLTAQAQTNFCLDNSASASASSTINANHPASSVIDGDRSGKKWGQGGGWNDQTRATFPDTLTVNFGRANAQAAIGQVIVYTLANDFSSEPNDLTSASDYGVEDATVELLDSVGNVVASQSVVGNTKAKIVFTFAGAPRASALRVVVTKSRDGLYSRITEIEASPPR